jgi:hypothetical protein
VAEQPAADAVTATAEAPPDAARVRARDHPAQLVALIAALTLAAFAAGFALGLIVH